MQSKAKTPLSQGQGQSAAGSGYTEPCGEVGGRGTRPHPSPQLTGLGDVVLLMISLATGPPSVTLPGFITEHKL